MLEEIEAKLLVRYRRGLGFPLLSYSDRRYNEDQRQQSRHASEIDMVRAKAKKWTFHVQVLNNVQKL